MIPEGRSPSRFFRSTEGAAAVEFAIVLSLLLVIVMGIIDFGHAWFLRQIITNASREGARAGVIAQTPPVSEAVIKATVLDYLHPSGLDTSGATTVQVSGAGGAPGTRLIFTVTSTKVWWIINKFVPGLGDDVPITAQTSMRIE